MPALRRYADVELSVPFVGVHGPFTDLLVHNADMRVPLGAPWEPGPAFSLMLAVCGRRVGLGALEGPGCDVLAGRI